MKVEERLQALLDAVKLVEKDIEHIEFLAALAKDTLSFVKSGEEQEREKDDRGGGEMSEEGLPKEEERKFRERSLVASIERQIKSARRITDVIAEVVQRAKAAMNADDYAYVEQSICDVEKQVEKLSKELLYAQMLCWDLMKVRGDE